MGGENICVTRGVVSRIDLMDYTFSPIGRPQSGPSGLRARIHVCPARVAADRMQKGPGAWRFCIFRRHSG